MQIKIILNNKQKQIITRYLIAILLLAFAAARNTLAADLSEVCKINTSDIPSNRVCQGKTHPLSTYLAPDYKTPPLISRVYFVVHAYPNSQPQSYDSSIDEVESSCVTEEIHFNYLKIIDKSFIKYIELEKERQMLWTYPWASIYIKTKTGITISIELYKPENIHSKDILYGKYNGLPSEFSKDLVNNLFYHVVQWGSRVPCIEKAKEIAESISSEIR